MYFFYLFFISLKEKRVRKQHLCTTKLISAVIVPPDWSRLCTEESALTLKDKNRCSNKAELYLPRVQNSYRAAMLFKT